MIDIIIPYYNSVKYIPAICEALNNQTDKSFKVYFIADGEDFGEKSTLENLSTNFQYEVHIIKKQGPGGCRNYGVSISENQYLTFVDIDDVIELEYVSTFNAFIEKTHADIYECLYLSKNPDGKVLSGSPLESTLSNTDRVLDLALGKLPRLSWGKVYKRSHLHNVRAVFPQKIHNGEDHIFLMRAYSGNPSVEVVYKYLYNWIRWSTSLTNKAPNMSTIDDFIMVSEIKVALLRNYLVSDIKFTKQFSRRLFKELRVLVRQVDDLSENSSYLIKMLLNNFLISEDLAMIRDVVRLDGDVSYWQEFQDHLRQYD